MTLQNKAPFHLPETSPKPHLLSDPPLFSLELLLDIPEYLLAPDFGFPEPFLELGFFERVRLLFIMNATPKKEENVNGCETEEEADGVAHLVRHGVVAVQLEDHVHEVHPVLEELRCLVVAVRVSPSSVLLHVCFQGLNFAPFSTLNWLQKQALKSNK